MAGETHAGGSARALRLLLDSNVLFSAEPFAGQLEHRFPDVAEPSRVASAQGHRVLVHPAPSTMAAPTQTQSAASNALHRTQ